jgi:exodeoxyribonuclease VII large subunit
VRLSQQVQKLDELEQRLAGAVTREIRTIETRVNSTAKRLNQAHPGQRLVQQVRRLEDLEQRLAHSMRASVHSDASRVSDLFTRLVQHSPGQLVREFRLKHAAFDSRLRHAWKEYYARQEQRLSQSARALEQIPKAYFTAKENRLGLAIKTLNTASPLATLARGFAMVTRPDGTIVTDASSVSVGDEIQASLANGKLTARVTGKGE